MYLVVLLNALFASIFTVAKSGLQYCEPVFFVGSRMVVAGILLMGYQYFFNREQFWIRKENFLTLFLLALFNIYLTNIFEFWGLQELSSFKTCFIYSLSPFISAIISFFIFNERMNWKKWGGLSLGFIGFVPILIAESGGEELGFISWAECFVIMASIFSVLGWILLRKLVKEGNYSSLTANGASMILGGAIALIHSGFTENWDPFPVTEFGPFAKSALWMIVVSSLICYNLYGYLLKRFTATFMSLAGFITPLFAALLGWYYLDETITISFYISAILVFSGLIIFNQEELKQGYAIR